ASCSGSSQHSRLPLKRSNSFQRKSFRSSNWRLSSITGYEETTDCPSPTTLPSPRMSCCRSSPNARLADWFCHPETASGPFLRARRAEKRSELVRREREKRRQSNAERRCHASFSVAALINILGSRFPDGGQQRCRSVAGLSRESDRHAAESIEPAVALLRGFGSRRPGEFFVDDLATERDALVADVDAARTGDELLHLFLKLAAEGTAVVSHGAHLQRTSMFSRWNASRASQNTAR